MRTGACKQRWCGAGGLMWLWLALWVPAGALAQGIGPSSFSSPLGAHPAAALSWGGDGVMYGTTQAGGNISGGTVFTVGGDGSNFAVLHSLAGADGLFPNASLVLGWDGNWYGTAAYGGLGCGVIFKLASDGTGYTVLYTFTGRDGDGAYPVAGLILGADWALYGTCYAGGEVGVGTVFRINSDGTGYQVLHGFNVVDGAWPRAALMYGSDGALYGTTFCGGTNDVGTVFRLNCDGTGYSVLHHFSNDVGDGAYPFSPVLLGWDWALYGTTSSGGTNNAGTVFRLNNDGTGFSLLHSFARDGVDGACPYSSLILGFDWGLYGTTLQGGSSDVGTVYRLNTDGSSYAVLHNFLSDGLDGTYPYSPVVQGPDDALYGATLQGGNDDVGTLYRLNLDGSAYSVPHAFTSTGSHAPSVTGVPAPRLVSVTILPDKNFQVTLAGASNLVWRVEATTSLASPVSWNSVGQVTNTNGLVRFTDLSATNYPQRYYRAVWP